MPNFTSHRPPTLMPAKPLCWAEPTRLPTSVTAGSARPGPVFHSSFFQNCAPPSWAIVTSCLPSVVQVMSVFGSNGPLATVRTASVVLQTIKDLSAATNARESALGAQGLIERGVRFVQIYSDGEWDAHSDLAGNH